MFEVTFLDAVMLWAQTLQNWLAKHDVQLTFGRSEGDRPKHSSWVNIRSSDREGELLVWDSGEAELNLSDGSGAVTREHHDLRDISDLAPLLQGLIDLVD